LVLIYEIPDKIKEKKRGDASANKDIDISYNHLNLPVEYPVG
jgi:hypothetical protein